jgi:hypothetical protein
MKTLVAKSVFAAVLISASLAFAADPLRIGTFPAPLHLMNFSVPFAGYSEDLTLLSGTLNGTIISKSNSLMIVIRPATAGAETRRASAIKRADASNFRFDARLPDSPVGLRVPQAGTLYFTPSGAWSFKKEN